MAHLGITHVLIRFHMLYPCGGSGAKMNLLPSFSDLKPDLVYGVHEYFVGTYVIAWTCIRSRVNLRTTGAPAESDASLWGDDDDDLLPSTRQPWRLPLFPLPPLPPSRPRSRLSYHPVSFPVVWAEREVNKKMGCPVTEGGRFQHFHIWLPEVHPSLTPSKAASVE